MSLSQRLSSLIFGVFLLSLPVEAYIHETDLPEWRQTLIRLGYHAPYNEKTINSVILNEYDYSYKLPLGIDKEPQYQYNIIAWSDKQKTFIDILFWSSQVLDVYSTYRGLKYDCLYETNPLLDRLPSVSEMITLKAAGIGTAYKWTGDQEGFWYGFKLGNGMTTSLVVANNFRLLNKAQRKCNKR